MRSARRAANAARVWSLPAGERVPARSWSRKAEGLLQRGLDLDDDVTVRMIGSQRLCPT